MSSGAGYRCCCGSFARPGQSEGPGLQPDARGHKAVPWKLKTQPSPHSAHIFPNGHRLKEPVLLSLGPGQPVIPRVLTRLCLPPSSSGLDTPRLDGRPPPHAGTRLPLLPGFHTRRPPPVLSVRHVIRDEEGRCLPRTRAERGAGRALHPSASDTRGKPLQVWPPRAELGTVNYKARPKAEAKPRKAVCVDLVGLGSHGF